MGQDNNESQISGLMIDEPADQTFSDMVEEVLVIIRLKGQRPVYAFDVTDNLPLVAQIVSEVEEEVVN